MCKREGKPKKGKKSAVKKIYKTKDGKLGGSPKVTKPRNVAVIEQRKKDGALGVVKITSKEGKEAKIGKLLIPDLVLLPKDHPSLEKDSVLSRNVILGVKQPDGSYKLLFASDMVDTGDRLTKKELKKIRKEVHNDTPEHRKTYKTKRKRWFHHFEK